MQDQQTPLIAGSGWQAHLDMRFDHDGDRRRTRLCACHHHGPLQVQRAFYPEADGTCHVYILHPPGGVVGGDGLTVQARLVADAQVLITSPAAGKFYRSRGALARQTQTLQVTAGAMLEWLPQESIVFQGARVHAMTRIELQGDAGFIGWEILCLGRPAAGERFEQGRFVQGLEIWRDNRPLYLERGHYTGGSELLAAHWGLQGQPVVATLIAAVRRPELLEPLRLVLAEAANGDDRVSASQLDGVLVCRYLGGSTERARRVFRRAWELLRPALLGKATCTPRIWAS